MSGPDAQPDPAAPNDLDAPTAATALDRWRSGLFDAGGDGRPGGPVGRLVDRWRSGSTAEAEVGAGGPPWSSRTIAAAVAVAVVGLVAAVVVVRVASGPARPPAAVATEPAPRTTGTAPVDPDPPDAVGPVATGPPNIVVAVAGAVTTAGVYRLATGSRVADLLAAAGGTAGDADVDRLNLAATLRDGDRVYVPRRGDTDPPSVVDPAGGGAAADGPAGTARPDPVDLNRASAEQLDALPGVGPSTAAAIVQYRSEHGPFRSVDDLANVRGIGPAKLAQLRPRVRL